MTKPSKPRSAGPDQKARLGETRRPGRLSVIDCDEHIEMGLRSLRRKCPTVRAMYKLAGNPPLRRRPPGFEGLARIVVGQQLSVASAAAIWNRFEQSVPAMTADALIATPDETLRGAGLSRPKVRTLRAMSQAVAAGLDLERLQQVSDTEVREALTAISGIGPWTADIFMMFCLGRPDAFAPGDLALQIAAQYVLERDTKLSAGELEELAERWRPWRSVAARLLWAYYKVVKDARSGVPL